MPIGRFHSVVSNAVELCKRFEGLYLKPYLCPAGVATVGFGTTIYPNGVKVTLKDPQITKEQAEKYLLWHLETVCSPAVKRLCPNLEGERLGAIIDFTYNLGAGNLAASTLRKCINKNDWEGAKIQLMRWNKAGGKVLAGLNKRRAAEAAYL